MGVLVKLLLHQSQVVLLRANVDQISVVLSEDLDCDVLTWICGGINNVADVGLLSRAEVVVGVPAHAVVVGHELSREDGVEDEHLGLGGDGDDLLEVLGEHVDLAVARVNLEVSLNLVLHNQHVVLGLSHVVDVHKVK